MKKLFSLLFMLFFALVLAQNQYYILHGNKTLNETSYKSFKDSISKKGKVTEKIALVFKKNDSTFVLPRLKVELPGHSQYYFNNQVYFEQIFKKNINFTKLKIISKNKNIDKSKPYFINCWYTHCKPCVAEIADLNKLQEEYKNKVNFIAITFDEKTVVNNFLEKTKFNFIHLVHQQSLMNLMEISFYPTSFILYQEGNFISFASYQDITSQMYTKQILDKL